MTRLSCISAFLIFVLPLCAPLMAQDDEAVSEAAEELRQLLREAADSGYVSLKGEAGTADAIREAGKPIGTKSISRSLRLGSGTPPVPPKSFCELAEVFSFDEFEETPTYDDIFKLRAELVDIKGNYLPEVGSKLAKTYLAVALPEEVIALEELVDSKEVTLAARMARVLAGTGAAEIDEINSYLSCTDKAGLWIAAGLARTDINRALEYTSEYLYLMSELPPELEFSLATKLGIIAAEAERFDLAKELLVKAKKQERNEDAAVLFLESLIDASKGKEAGLKQLQRVAQVQSPVQAKALLSLGELSESAPYSAYSKDLHLVSTQYRDLSESHLAKLMNIRFLAEEGAYQKAVDTTLKDFPDVDANRLAARETIGTVVLKKFREAEETVKFTVLDHYTRNFSFYLGFSDETNLRLQASGAAIGFQLPHLLDVFLKEHDFSRYQRDFDLLQAKAALQEGRPELAWSICSLYEGQAEFDQISATAAIVLEDPDAALVALGRLPQTGDILRQSAQVAWNAGMWERARDYYAEILLTDNTSDKNIRYNLAAYMAGEQGGFYTLESSSDIQKIEELFNSYEDEKSQLTEYLRNG